MKNTWIILSCAGLLAACSRPAVPGTAAAHAPDGYYYGSDRLFTNVFVKLAHDTAFADFIHVEKFPRALLTDTLLYDAGQNAWRGSTSKLYQKGNAWRIANNPPRFTSGIKIKPDETYYKEHIDAQKNFALSRKDYEDYFRKNENNPEAAKKYAALESKYDIGHLSATLKHAEFLKEYEKFKAALTNP